MGRYNSSSKDNMYGVNNKPGRSFLDQNKKGKDSLIRNGLAILFYSH